MLDTVELAKDESNIDDDEDVSSRQQVHISKYTSAYLITKTADKSLIDIRYIHTHTYIHNFILGNMRIYTCEMQIPVLL